MESLEVVSVEVKDVLGVKRFAMQPGKVTLLAGSNASGKTSILEAARLGIGGGNLAKLARIPEPGEDPESIEPEVVWVLGSDAHLRVERKGSRLRVRQRVGDTAAYEDVQSPQSFLSALFDPRGCNPLDLLRAKGKDVARLLLEALPVEHTPETFRAAVGIDDADSRVAFPDPPASLHPLQQIELVRDAIFRERTGVNRDAKAKRQSAEQLKRQTPATIVDVDEARLAGLSERIERETADQARAEAEAKAKAIEQDNAANLERESRKSAIMVEHERDAARMRAEVEAIIARARDAAREECAGIDEEFVAVVSEIRFDLDKARAEIALAKVRTDGLRDRLAALKAERDASIKARQLADLTEQYESEAETIEAEADRLTSALECVDAYRLGLLKTIPIEGLSIDGEVVMVNGVPWETVNKAKRYEVAVKVAALRTSGLPLKIVFVDDAETLDGSNFALLVDEIKRQGVTAFVGRVTDEPLRAEVL